MDVRTGKMFPTGTTQDRNGKQCDISFPTTIPDRSCPFSFSAIPDTAKRSIVPIPGFYHPTSYYLLGGFQQHCFARYCHPMPTFAHTSSHPASQYNWHGIYPVYLPAYLSVSHHMSITDAADGICNIVCSYSTTERRLMHCWTLPNFEIYHGASFVLL